MGASQSPYLPMCLPLLDSSFLAFLVFAYLLCYSLLQAAASSIFVLKASDSQDASPEKVLTQMKEGQASEPIPWGATIHVRTHTITFLKQGPYYLLLDSPHQEYGLRNNAY